MEKTAFINMRNVSKSYFGVQALDNVDFSLRHGEIHCLIGENGSGKSTLIKILCGVVKPNPGTEINIDQVLYKRMDRSKAMELGIGVIYQDLSLFPNLTVAENICFNLYVEEGKRFVNKSRMREIAKEKIAMIGQELDPDALVGDLSVADRQLVAICRSLVGNLRLLIMDEPTSSLTAKEVQNLFRIVNRLVSSGTTILFVSHKLEEVIQIADRVTVFKDGKNIGMLENDNISKENIIYLMTGKKLDIKKLDQDIKSNKEVLKVSNLTRKGEFRNISFSVREGEVIGIIGLLGAGRTELARALIGYRPADSGSICIEGKTIKLRSMKDGINAGMGMVSEDRLNEGLIMVQSVENNLSITTLEEQVNRFRMLDRKKTTDLVTRMISRIGIKVPSTESHVGTLSGGNQQKVVVGKWLATNPKILILDGPTIGIDIAARSSIYDIIKKLAREGMAVIIISDEVLEVIENTHRIFVMSKGEFVNEFVTADVQAEDIEKCINQTEEVGA